jgi:type IV secretion system protein VirB8
MTMQDPIDPQVHDSWALSVTDDLERSRRFAWAIAGISAGVAVLLAIALVLLLPLKETVPYTILVDRQTGNVELLNPLDTERVNADAALTRSFLVQYVTAREGFDAPDFQQDYRRVGLFSASEARSQYMASVDARNPQSPLVALPRGSTVDVEVRSISSLSANRSLVRFTTVLRDGGARPQQAQYWAAVIDWQYSGAAMSEDDRLLNPLGFQVTRYRRNAETLPEVVEAQEAAVEAAEQQQEVAR